MVYVIEGHLHIQERPELYLDTYIDLHTGKTTDSERKSKSLAKKGHRVIFNNNLETALSMCRTKDKEVLLPKTFSPQSWQQYLNENFVDAEEEHTVEGQLRVWKELRFPSPWICFAIYADLVDIFEFKNGRFYKDPEIRNSGKKSSYGIFSDCFYCQRTKGSVRRTYIPNDGILHAAVQSRRVDFKNSGCKISLERCYPDTYPGIIGPVEKIIPGQE